MVKSIKGDQLSGEIPTDADAGEDPRLTGGLEFQRQAANKRRFSKSKRRISRTRVAKPRFGLPEGFIPRFERRAEGVLLEDNIYRLPNGQELIPQKPSGKLGRLSHLYALLSAEQYQGEKRGSVYVRSDGRIFDYSFDHADPLREFFDTGYTIHHLERTGRYVTGRYSKIVRAGSGKRT